MKVYLMIKEEIPFRPETLVLVGRQSDADKLVKDGYATYYEVVQVLNGSQIDEFYKRINEGIG